MNVSQSKFPLYLGFGMLLLLGATLPALARNAPESGPNAVSDAPLLPWQTQARWRHGLWQKTSGELVINDAGVTFRPTHGSRMRWSFEQIQTFDLTAHRLMVTGYQNRRWHFHGERTFRFDLESAIPPAVAAALARKVGKPSDNGVPNPDLPATAALPARQRTLGGGTNGILRFREGGIDYVTRSGNGGRSWRWADIETLALPDPYHLTVSGYRSTFAFELKRPMKDELFDWLWNRVYGHGLTGLNPENGASR